MVAEKKTLIIPFSAVILAIAVYSKLCPLPSVNSIKSLTKAEDIIFLTGKICSNPVKISDRYYSTMLKLESCKNDSGGFADCSGKFKIIIPSEFVEAFYPQKLYSALKKKQKISEPIENGVLISAQVKYIQPKKINDKLNEAYFLVEDINSCGFKNNFLSVLQKWRAYCRLEFKRLMSAWGRAGGLFLALLSGSKEYLEKRTGNLFRLCGLSHILALSGMHLSLVSSIAQKFGSHTEKKKLAQIFQLATVCLFVWFAGLSPSLLRALISCIILAACNIFCIKPKSGIYVLSLTFLIHTFIAPQDLSSAAFMLSYGALAGIFIFSEFIKNKISFTVPDFINENLSASIGANAFTAPICVKLFGFFSPAGIVCTLLVSPLITIFLYCGLIFMCVSFFIPGFVFIAGFLMNALYWIIRLIAGLGSVIPVVKA
ncbi:ComEC/Rec2 family competence protein [Treponema sp.]|uniref:ComEC/Rec2 family competence protein n=1 Tax=Treponema sp. TaxID=166 RepID=UPI00298E4AD9|nr:ComEC/Rec2 family competence protein [Treponema sp.]MCR5612812.1 ComEC/Rec2 family competence protein [Treponema sp.]